jgi:diguanylate cyclase (GGDEF) domain
VQRTRRSRWALTRYFAAVSIVSVLILGGGLVWTTTRIMREQALRAGASAARLVEPSVRDVVPATAYQAGAIDAPTREHLDRVYAEFSGQVVGMRLWNADGTLLYDANPQSSAAFPRTDPFDRAVRLGEVSTEIVTATIGEVGDPDDPAPQAQQLTALSVYVPVVVGDLRVGALELSLDYTETDEALQDAARTVTLVISAGLLLLWLLLFRTVRNASKTLQTSALENARLALLDPLTGLPNRRMLMDRMRRAIDQAEEDGTGVGLVLLDVDRFKDINDSLGHDRGDELLVQVAHRLRAALRERDVVARLGGDEFAILLPAIRSVANAERLAQRVRNLFAPAFNLGGLELHVDSSIGVACIPEHAVDASGLMRKADVAMYTAKTHRTGVAVYSPDEDDSSPARLVLLGDLHRALADRQELVMFYQPKISLTTGQTVGLEALMRWVHPTRGLLVPDLFVPLAETSGLIHDLTAFALETTIAQLARWQAEGREMPVAVNLSAHNLTSTQVAETIEELLHAHQVRPDLLEVEITETALVHDPSRVVPVLEQLADIGVLVSIDDFGIGNTSISQLRDLPVARIKIDRTFIHDLTGASQRAGSEMIVKAMVDLAHSFGLEVVAEGVEDSDTEALIRALGVDQAQGFLYSQPVPADEVPEPEPSSARGAGGRRGADR